MNTIPQPTPVPITIDKLAPYHVVPQFMAEATALRQVIDRHFDEPYKAGAEHQVWITGTFRSRIPTCAPVRKK